MTETIEPFKTESHLGGEQRKYRFDNGYGASVIQDGYGHEAGFFELAVLLFDDKGKYELTYDTPITDNVIGWLDEDEVQETLRRIRDLPRSES